MKAIYAWINNMVASKPFHSIKDILGEIMKKGKWDSKLKRYSLFSQWPSLVGKEIAREARPKMWQGNILVVEVKHSSWLQELKMMELEILKKIRSAHPEVPIDKIRWVLG